MRVIHPLGRLWAPFGVAASMLAVEAVLVERKFGVFGGGFGVSQQVDRPVEWAAVVLAAASAQALLVGLLWLGIRAAHGKRRDSALATYNFLFFTVAVGAALLAVKYQILSYFSDAIGFQVIRNLGGGSLADAALFVMDEAALLLIAGLGAAAAWWIGWRLVQRFAPTDGGPSPLHWRHLLWLALPLPLVVFAANRDPDTRYALTRFNAYGAANIALHQASDFDRDGYSWFSARIDTHPFNAARHPLALDIPSNGIDEDGLGGDFRFDGPIPAATAVRLPTPRKHLLLVVLESMRGDVIGKRIDGREVTPVLNALARDGTHVREAYSHVGFTTASLKSLFSGKLDPAPGDASLFRDLKANGYRIGVFSGQPESFGDIASVVGMRKAADVFVDAETLKDQRAFGFAAQGSLLIDGAKVLNAFDRRFGARWAQPTFVYWNIQEAHFPYHHPGIPPILTDAPIARGDISLANRAAVERTYWNAAAYADRLLGQMIDRLKAAGVWDDTLLVVTADHGESLFDDAFLGHGHVINRQQTQVPLVLSEPGLGIATPVGLSDFRALILRALGADVTPGSLRPVFQYIGGLDWPTAIGMVETGGVWTVMRMDSELVRFSDTGVERRYAELDARQKKRADRLIDEWARQRWLAHISRRPLPPHRSP